MFLRQKLGFHRRIAELGKHQPSAEAVMVERHGLRTIAVEKKKGCTAKHRSVFFLPRTLIPLAERYKIQKYDERFAYVSRRLEDCFPRFEGGATVALKVNT